MKNTFSSKFISIICALCALSVVLEDADAPLDSIYSTLFVIGTMLLATSLETTKFKPFVLIPGCFLFAIAEIICGATNGDFFFLPSSNCIFCGALHAVAGIVLLLITILKCKRKKDGLSIAVSAALLSFIVYAFNAAINLFVGNEVARDVRLWTMTVVFCFLGYSFWDFYMTEKNRAVEQDGLKEEDKNSKDNTGKV